MTEIPAESTIDSLGTVETQRLAVTLLLDPDAVPTLEQLKELVKTVCRALDPEKEQQDVVTFEEALALYDHLHLEDNPDVPEVDPTTEEPLAWLLPIVTYYAANLP